MLHPYLQLAWNHDDRTDPRTVRADLSLMVNFGSNVSGWIGYNGRFADSNQKLNSVILRIKVAF